MPSFIRNPKEFWSGVMFVSFGLFALVIAQQDYSIGSAGRMGPGYFPSVLGGLLALIGLVSIVRSFFSSGHPMEKFAIKQAVLVLMSVLLFGILVRGAGLVAAIIVLVMVSFYASSKFRVTPALLFAIGASIFCVLVFVKALGLPMPIVGPWFGIQ